MPIAGAIAPIAKAVAPSLIGGLLGRGASSGARGRSREAQRQAAEAARRIQETGEQMLEIMNDRWDFYKEHGEQVDITLIEDAMNFFRETFEGGAEQAASRAAEDVATAFDRAGAASRRNLQRFGVDPTSGRFVGQENAVAIQRAEAEAGSRNQARRTEEDRARALLRDVSDIGRSAIGEAARFGGIGGNLFSSAGELLGATGRAAERDASGSAALVGDIAGRIPFDQLFGGGDERGGITDEEALIVDEFPAPTLGGGARGGMVRSGRSYASGGIATNDARGGGKLRGPGTGTSDSIPAIVDGRRPVRLSDGEFIIPAKVVRQKGTEFFNKLIA